MHLLSGDNSFEFNLQLWLSTSTLLSNMWCSGGREGCAALCGSHLYWCLML